MRTVMGAALGQGVGSPECIFIHRSSKVLKKTELSKKKIIIIVITIMMMMM